MAPPAPFQGPPEGGTHGVGVGAVLVLGAVGGVAERLGTSGELAHVRLLPSVGAQVRLQVLQPRISLVTTLELQQEHASVLTHAN